MGRFFVPLGAPGDCHPGDTEASRSGGRRLARRLGQEDPLDPPACRETARKRRACAEFGVHRAGSGRQCGAPSGSEPRERREHRSGTGMKDAWHIESFDWLHQLPAECLEKLRQGSTRREYDRGEMIFSPTPSPDSIYLLERGLVRIFRLSRSGDEATFGFVSPGNVFGELAAFGDYPRESFASAVQPSLAWRISRDVFQGVIADRPDLVVAVIQQVGNRFKRIESRVEHLVFRDVRSRVALILCELGEDLGQPDGNGPERNLSLSQAELATLVGTSRQSVNTTLHELEREGLIELGRRRIRLLRPQDLMLAARRDGS